MINVNLSKDLHGNEEICQNCSGTGLVVLDNRYGLSDDPNKKAGHFPYKHQSLSFCPFCFNGVVHRCEFCGKIITKGRLKCDCDKQKEIDEQESIKKEKELFDKAPIAPKEVEESCFYLYSDYYPYNNGYFSDWDDFFDAWQDNHFEEDDKPEFVWITKEEPMKIDAWDIVNSAAEEMYEDAIENISHEEIVKLQKYLDEWCSNCGVGDTYFESHEYKVRIPWD